MKKWCAGLGAFNAFFGTIGSFLVASELGKKVQITDKYFTQTVRDWPLTIGIFAGCMLSVIVLATFLFGLSVALGKLEAIEASLSESYDEGGEGSSYSLLNNSSDGGYWTCACGKRNPNYTGTCSCGRDRDNQEESSKE